MSRARKRLKRVPTLPRRRLGHSASDVPSQVKADCYVPRFTIRQLLAVMLAFSFLLALAAPLGWLGALLMGVSLPVATYIGTGTLLAFGMSRVTSLALTVFATCLAVIFASRFASA